MRRFLIPTLRRLGILQAVLRARAVLRSRRSALRAAVWRRRLSRLSLPDGYEVVQHRAGTWVSETRAAIDPVETFVGAFKQCLTGAGDLGPREFGVLVREGGRYPAIEMSPGAWSALVTHWKAGAAPWNLHVQLPSRRSQPICPRLASERATNEMSKWSNRVIVFLAVHHSSSTLPVGRRLGVDVYVTHQIDPRRAQRPWGNDSLGDWVRGLRRPPFPIDAVYTWVDDSDPAWIDRRLAAQPAAKKTATDSTSADRYANRDELRYSLRSLALYAEWFDRMCLVTDRQTPAWADSSLEIVDHQDILDDEVLPTFNSHAIETGLHRVPDLHEHYVYLNDDVFFDGPIHWSLLFTAEGHSRFFVSKAIIPDPGQEETTIDYATSNGRALLERELGLFISQKMKHTPQPQRRSVQEWMDDKFAAEREATSRAQFRSVDDQSFVSFLHHYAGFTLGKAQPGSNLRYDYFNAADDRLSDRLAFLRDQSGRIHTYCINDGDIADDERAEVDLQIRHHLSTALPFPSSWESMRSENTSTAD